MVFSFFAFRKHFVRTMDSVNTVYLSKQALHHNFCAFVEHSGGKNVFPVLKSNAYGHGIREVAEMLWEYRTQIPYIVVDSYFEAIRIWKVVPFRILLAGPILPNNIAKMDFSRATPIVSDIETLRLLGLRWKKISFHLKIDTGMHRQGIRIEDLDNFLLELARFPRLNFEGLCTHFADADGEDESYSRYQETLFDRAIALVRLKGYEPRFIHTANSAATIRWYASSVSNVFRLGIGLYGIDPTYSSTLPLTPIMDFESILMLRKSLKKGERVSYNGTFEAPEDRVIGIVPVGYYEGVPRALSNHYSFYANGVALPILGRVTMNMTVVDVTHSSIPVGTPVSIISSTNSANNIEVFSRAAGIIPYEALVGLTETTRRKVR